jgi:hypothetical protein
LKGCESVLHDIGPQADATILHKRKIGWYVPFNYVYYDIGDEDIHSTERHRWSLWSQLDDLDFADDLALPSHNQQQMHEKTITVAEN